MVSSASYQSNESSKIQLNKKKYSYVIKTILFEPPQAIGRVIRHKNDWGAVFLCDSRFKQPDVKNEISDWVKTGNGLKEFDNFPSALIETMNFFKAKPKTAGNPKKKMLTAS